MVIPSHHLFLSSLTVSPLSVLSEAPNPRVTKWEETSCFKTSVFSSIGSRVNGPDVAFCGQCYALFQRFKSVEVL